MHIRYVFCVSRWRRAQNGYPVSSMHRPWEQWFWGGISGGGGDAREGSSDRVVCRQPLTQSSTAGASTVTPRSEARWVSPVSLTLDLWRHGWMVYMVLGLGDWCVEICSLFGFFIPFEVGRLVCRSESKECRKCPYKLGECWAISKGSVYEKQASYACLF